MEDHESQEAQKLAYVIYEMSSLGYSRRKIIKRVADMTGAGVHGAETIVNALLGEQPKHPLSNFLKKFL